MVTLAEIESLQFNNNVNFIIDGINGLSMPPMRVAKYNLAGEHFGIFVNAYYGARSWSLEGWVRGDTFAEFVTNRDRLLESLDIISKTQRTFKFTLVNGRSVEIVGVCQNLDFAPEAGYKNAARFQASIYSAYPFMQGQTESSVNLTLQSGGGGEVPFPELPASLNADSGGQTTIINNGNAPYYPTIRVYAPCTNPEIKNETTGKSIKLTLSLSGNEYVDIDMRRKTITDSYGTNRYSTKSGEFWHLQSGSNVIRFLADVYDASALVKVTYRDSWLGI